MAELPYVCLYARYLDTLEPYTDAERGRIMTAMLSYSVYGEIPAFEGNEKFIWPTIKAQIDRDTEAYQKRCEKNRANGAKGGRPKNQTETEKTEWFSEEPKEANTNTNTKTNTNTNTSTNTSTNNTGTADSDESNPPAKKPVKHKHGEYSNVLLTDEELEKLKTDFPDWFERIERLSAYMASTGKPYKSHYATIRNWARKDQNQPTVQSRPSQPRRSGNVFLDMLGDDD